MTDPAQPSKIGPYNYEPTTWICITFVVLFSLTGIGHLGQAIYPRIWWLIPTMVLCGLAEVIGWAARLWSSYDPQAFDPFLIQMTTTIIAPSFMTAAMFIILGQIMTVIGVEYSRLRPKTFGIVFISADILALTIQAVGGAIASKNAKDDPHGAEVGAQIMLAGIFIQMAAVTLFVMLGVEYFIRVYRNSPVRPRSSPSEGSANEKSATKVTVPSKIKLMTIGLSLTTVFIYVRSIYRTIELLDGWNGKIFSNQRLFNLLDGVPIVIAMAILNVFHPAWLLPQDLIKEAAAKRSEESSLA
ncbi:hypothetical protein FRC02_007633 [Tulasnella sp. 418]|nr:hypothetical protein FRC02_007633 [Tulasnella sp. 418]